jgi:hypothetical protein
LKTAKSGIALEWGVRPNPIGRKYTQQTLSHHVVKRLVHQPVQFESVPEDAPGDQFPDGFSRGAALGGFENDFGVTVQNKNFIAVESVHQKLIANRAVEHLLWSGVSQVGPLG